MDDLIYGISVEVLQEITGEELRVIKQWKKGTRKPSESAIRLINLFVHGKACALLGNSWNGFYFRNGKLFVPEWRNGFSAGEIRTLFFRCQLVVYLESEIRLLKAELERRNLDIEELEIKADFYRRQISTESKFGMMLERCFGVM
ncbi:DUF3653 domain-containing protein [Nitrosomonas europaea]|uniref:Uncharacterized protein n=1 Tax=Nitrosomonas europaea (strain ATCC 19718 / CIP 103999 / KCTC 2705 / NBRC 14298) TaxID=228410 RepID=Q82W05_NITEU|nr:DUF3653 domain-containing protein [Nitrosomonas europaea]CAD84805.1 hypothetical protein NE0894 [Nitrosomonas europaea ATCC 19718]SDW17396.1 hypothetical protein SAMN05216310_10482 [Nitrosomonas europaea]SJZ33905.1 hypothetical protein SAMN02745113_00530 [Nitrosomonas europaea]